MLTNSPLLTHDPLGLFCWLKKMTHICDSKSVGSHQVFDQVFNLLNSRRLHLR